MCYRSYSLFSFLLFVFLLLSFKACFCLGFGDDGLRPVLGWIFVFVFKRSIVHLNLNKSIQACQAVSR